MQGNRKIVSMAASTLVETGSGRYQGMRNIRRENVEAYRGGWTLEDEQIVWRTPMGRDCLVAQPLKICVMSSSFGRRLENLRVEGTPMLRYAF